MIIKKFKIKSKGLLCETKRSGGFTLVEMLIAVSLFIVVVTISIGAILSVFDANRKAQSSKTVVDNLNLAIENMVRTVRFGSNYHCGSDGSLTSAKNCDSNVEGITGGAPFLAVQFEGNTVVYRWKGTINDPIEVSYDGGSNYTNITSPEVKIEYLRFRVFNTAADNEQPYVIAVIKGYSGSKPTAQTNFTIQTMMSQRKLDL